MRLSLGASTVLKGRRHRSPTPQKEEPPRRLSSSPQLDSTHAHTCLLCITPYASVRQRPLVPMGRLFSAIQSGSQAHPCLGTAKNRAFQDSAETAPLQAMTLTCLEGVNSLLREAAGCAGIPARAQQSIAHSLRTEVATTAWAWDLTPEAHPGTTRNRLMGCRSDMIMRTTFGLM